MDMLSVDPERRPEVKDILARILTLLKTKNQ